MDNKIINVKTAVAVLVSLALVFGSVPAMSAVASVAPDGSAVKSAAEGASVYAAVRTYKVTFKANGGTVTPKSKKVKRGKKIGKLPEPYRSGYVFLGWYTAKSGGTKIKSSTKIRKKMTVYAQWADAYPTITFDPNGGKFENDNQKTKQVTYKESYGELPTPTYTGYHFLGWYTAKTGGMLITPTSVVKVKRDTTLYAQWEMLLDVKLVDMDYFASSGGWDRELTIFDNTNNLRSGWVGGTYYPGQESITFLLSGQYSTMDGVFALTYDKRNTTAEMMVSVYCDGILKYQSAYITVGVMPISVSLDVRNVQQIKYVVDNLRGSSGSNSIILDATFKRS